MGKRINEVKKTYKIEIYIGSDNDSRKINDLYLEKIRRWANSVFPDGYTLLECKGYYNGISEDSILIQVLLDYDSNLKHSIEKLKQEFRQNSVLVVKSRVDYEMI